MLQYKGKNPQRKNLVNRIAALTGKKAVYTKVPRCAYEIGDYIVEKDGTLVVLEDEADEELLKTLADEDLIYLDFAQTLRPADECSSEEPAAWERKPGIRRERLNQKRKRAWYLRPGIRIMITSTT